MKNFILTVLFLWSGLSFAQIQPLLYSWGDYNGKYTVSNIQENGDNFQIFKIGTASVEMLKRRNSTNLAETLISKGLNSCNYVECLKVNKDGKKSELRKLYFILPGNDPINSSDDMNQFFSEGEIKKKFPTLYQEKEEIKYCFENSRIKKYAFDTYFQQYFLTDSKFISCEHPSRTDKIARRASYNSVFDPTTRRIISVYPADKDKADKYASYKNFEIIITSSSCKVITKNSVKFDFARVYKEPITVFDKNDPQKAAGYLLLFERLNAGKATDPDKANMRIVYCPENGTPVSKIVKFRPDNKGWQRIHGAFADEGDLYVSYHCYGSDGAFWGIKKMDKDGNITDYKSTEEELRNNSEIAEGNFGQLQENRSRKKVLGILNEKPEFKWGTQDFAFQGIQSTDSKLYIWGQAKYRVKDPNFNGEGVPTSIDYFAEGFVFVCNASDMSFEKMFMINLPPNKQESIFRLIAKKGNEIEFFIPVEAKDQKDYSKTIITKNLSGNDRYGEDFKRLLHPVFMTVNGNTAKFKYYKNVYAIDLENGLITCKDGNRYIVGFDAYAGTEPDDSGEIEYENQHYFHFVPVNY